MTLTQNPQTDPQQSLKTNTPPGDFRLCLQRELIRRCQANPKYSLRAFARFLDLDSSRLSKILRGERPVGISLLTRLAQRLGLSQDEIEAYRAATRSRKHGVANLAEDAIRSKYLELSLDAFESIEDWRHYAILELMKVRDFRPEIKWIARVLDITVSESRAFVERLERVGLLEIRADGTWVDRSNGFTTHILSETETTYAHRRSQAKILELAIDALGTIPMERRDQSSMMMATSASKIAEAKKRIRKFRRELCELLEDCEDKDAVYQISVSLFPLVEPKTAHSKKEGITK